MLRVGRAEKSVDALIGFGRVDFGQLEAEAFACVASHLQWHFKEWALKQEILAITHLLNDKRVRIAAGSSSQSHGGGDQRQKGCKFK